MNTTTDFSRALQVAAQLEVDANGQAHLPEALRNELRSRTGAGHDAAWRRPPVRISDADRARVLKLRGEGLPLLKIAKRTRLSYHRVWRVCWQADRE